MTRSPREERLLNKCLADIENRLCWGDSETWTLSDFEKLSDTIFADTGVRLSVTTLKRVWGKVKYDSRPTVTTLDTLARFNHHDSWRVYVHSQTKENALAEPAAGVIEEAPTGGKRSLSFVWVSAIALAAIVITGISFYRRSDKTESKKAATIDKSAYSFSVNKIATEGVPNSVVFTFDATAAPSDSVFIVQTWDIRRKTLVPKNGRHHSAIYYYPGFFRTKLIVDSTVVKTHDLMVATNGWLALLESDPIPVYFDKTDVEKNGTVEVNKDVLSKNNISLLPHPPKIRMFNQRDLGNLMNDNFEFETEFRNDFREGDNACQFAEVLIQCKDDIIIIPVSANECVGQLGLYAAGAIATSKTADLSGFGCDLSEWTKLRVSCINKQMTFFVNGKKAYSFSFPHDPTGIVGVQYRFNGTCAVKSAKFSNKGGAIDLFPRSEK